ncbi:MerR family transcriptional regulator [Veillonella sp. R32]|uniref:MerR family transcriptional regulator n=1 Tax=Veillonella sp. R32 TaxID=2021312 RepID=UPI001389E83C|nr:MerR family transcriptional regulator [Veillonella sp. R32]KAF1683356.1 MerR family transcriptional regulator [Veillonella sp. R32]
MEKLISISEMAKLHGMSRQTLIHYDKIGLFKPMYTNKRGFRYYSKRQIPFMRKIGFLKNLGISLKDIAECVHDNKLDNTIALLQNHRATVQAEIERLSIIEKRVSQQIQLLEDAREVTAQPVHTPFITKRSERQIIYKEYIEPINRENLSLTLVNLWHELFKGQLLPSAGFGSFFPKDSVINGQPLKGAGSCIFVPLMDLPGLHTATLPAGLYACLYKYGMPYDTKHIEELYSWLDAEGYELAGDIIDTCLLDTTLYTNDQEVDLCLLEMPIRKKDSTANL